MLVVGEAAVPWQKETFLSQLATARFGPAGLLGSLATYVWAVAGPLSYALIHLPGALWGAPTDAADLKAIQSFRLVGLIAGPFLLVCCYLVLLQRLFAHQADPMLWGLLLPVDYGATWLATSWGRRQARARRG